MAAETKMGEVGNMDNGALLEWLKSQSTLDEDDHNELTKLGRRFKGTDFCSLISADVLWTLYDMDRTTALRVFTLKQQQVGGSGMPRLCPSSPCVSCC